MLSTIENVVRSGKLKLSLKIPYSESAKLNSLYNEATVEEVEYLDDAISVSVIIEKSKVSAYEKYTVEVK